MHLAANAVNQVQWAVAFCESPALLPLIIVLPVDPWPCNRTTKPPPHASKVLDCCIDTTADTSAIATSQVSLSRARARYPIVRVVSEQRCTICRALSSPLPAQHPARMPVTYSERNQCLPHPIQLKLSRHSLNLCRCPFLCGSIPAPRPHASSHSLPCLPTTHSPRDFSVSWSSPTDLPLPVGTGPLWPFILIQSSYVHLLQYLRFPLFGIWWLMSPPCCHLGSYSSMMYPYRHAARYPGSQLSSGSWWRTRQGPPPRRTIAWT